MQDVIQKYMTAEAPRYTSYPTAPHFSPEVGSAEYRTWLERLDRKAPVSLYLHVPYCRQICWYCGCNMKLAARYEPIAAYMGDLMAELALVDEATPDGLAISHLHWGGGTPTALSPDDLERAMDAVAGRFAFAPGAERAIESDPRTLSREMTRRIGQLGFTRASFGVQEFDPRVQQAINRVQPPEMVAGAVSDLRAEGISAINFDLIYGLPHQTVDSLSRTVDLAVAMRPDRIALFGYAHVPWMAKNQRMIPEDSLPAGPERYAQATAAAERLAAHGYVRIGLDHFALPTDPMAIALETKALRRNFQGYTTDEAETLIGIGATAIGRTPDGYVQNIAETGAWTRAIRSGRLPIAKGYRFKGDDHERAAVIEGLMCFGEADLDDAGMRYDMELDELRPMLNDGLIELDGGRLRITEAGRPLVRVVAAAFDRYRRAGAARHSVAV